MSGSLLSVRFWLEHLSSHIYSERQDRVRHLYFLSRISVGVVLTVLEEQEDAERTQKKGKET